MGWLTDLSNVAVGAIERDRQITKEDLAIRAENLQANKAILLKQKEYTWSKELEDYETEKVKFDQLEAANAIFKIDSNDYNYAMRALPLTMEGWDKLTPELRTDAILEFKGKTFDYTLEGSRNELHKKAALEMTAINDIVAKQIKDAKGNSFLIKQILRKKDSAEKNILEDIESKLAAAETINLTERKVNPENVGLPVNVSGGVGTGTKYRNYKWIAKKNEYFLKEFNKHKTKIANYSGLNKDNVNSFVGAIILNTGDSDVNTNDLFVIDERTQTISHAKEPVKHFEKSWNNTRTTALKDFDVVNAYYELNGRSDHLQDGMSEMTFQKKVGNHISEYLVMLTDGNVLGKTGSIKNFLQSNTNAIVFPPLPIISMNNYLLDSSGNPIDGAYFPDADMTLTDSEGKQYTKNVREYVGLIYKDWIKAKAETRHKEKGGNLDDHINYLQHYLEKDNNKNSIWANEIRTAIANSFGFDETKVIEKDSEKVVVSGDTIKVTDKEEIKVEDKPVGDWKLGVITAADAKTGQMTHGKVGDTVMIMPDGKKIPLTKTNIELLKARNNETINALLSEYIALPEDYDVESTLEGYEGPYTIAEQTRYDIAEKKKKHKELFDIAQKEYKAKEKKKKKKIKVYEQ